MPRPPAAERATPRTGSRCGRSSSGRPASRRGQPRVSGPAGTVAPSGRLSSSIDPPSGPVDGRQRHPAAVAAAGRCCPATSGAWRPVDPWPPCSSAANAARAAGTADGVGAGPELAAAGHSPAFLSDHRPRSGVAHYVGRTRPPGSGAPVSRHHTGPVRPGSSSGMCESRWARPHPQPPRATVPRANVTAWLAC